MFRFFLPLALASTAASMTVFPGIMSESEAELYLEQAASAPGSLRNGKFVTVDAVVAKKIQTALRGRRLLDEKDGSSVWEAPVSSYPRNPLTSNIKGSLKTFHGDSAAYILLEESETDQVSIRVGSMVVFDKGEDSQLFFKGKTRALGPLAVVDLDKERNLRKKSSSNSDSDKSKKSGKKKPKGQEDSSATFLSRPSITPTSAPSSTPTSSPSSSPSKVPTGLPTTSPSVQPSLHPTNAPTNEPTFAPTGMPLAATSIRTNAPVGPPELGQSGPCVCNYIPGLDCIQCVGGGSDCQAIGRVQDCQESNELTSSNQPSLEPTNPPTKTPPGPDLAGSASFNGPCVCNYIPGLRCTQCVGGGEDCVGDCATNPASPPGPTDLAASVVYDRPCVCNYIPGLKCTKCTGGGEDCVGDCAPTP